MRLLKATVDSRRAAFLSSIVGKKSITVFWQSYVTLTIFSWSSEISAAVSRSETSRVLGTTSLCYRGKRRREIARAGNRSKC